MNNNNNIQKSTSTTVLNNQINNNNSNQHPTTTRNNNNIVQNTNTYNKSSSNHNLSNQKTTTISTETNIFPPRKHNNIVKSTSSILKYPKTSTSTDQISQPINLPAPLPANVGYHYSQTSLTTVVSRLSDNSLGFSVLSELVLDGLQVTDSVDYCLQNGDIIREINSEKVREIGIDRALKLLQNKQKRTYTLTILRIDPSDIYDISLNPKKGQGLGISVQGTEHASSDAWVMVTSINPDSVIGKTNKVHIGDQLLAVNDSILLGKSHDFAVSTLVNARNLKCLKMVFVRSKVQHDKYANVLENFNEGGQIRTIKIANKEGKSLGISIVEKSLKKIMQKSFFRSKNVILSNISFYAAKSSTIQNS